MILRCLTGLLLLTLILACNDENDNDLPVDCDGALEVVIVDYTGLDGCAWILESTSIDSRLEPINLLDFVSDPTDGQMITIGYTEKPDLFGTCQTGIIVEITCVQ